MDIIGWITDTAASLPLALALTLGGGFAFLESGLGLGFFVPGETIVMILAATFDAPWKAALYFAIATAGASAGDHVGYLLGRRFGTGIRDTRIIARLGRDNWDRAVAVLEKRGAWAVFLTRMVPVVRTLTPAAAGVAGVPYRRFLPASLAGAATWAGLYVGIGYFARSSLEAAQKYLGNAGYLLVGAVIVAAVVVVVIRIIRRRRPSGETRARLPVGGAAPRATSLRTTLVEQFRGRPGAIVLFTVRAGVILAASGAVASQHFFIAAILLLVTLVAKPVQARLRPSRTGEPEAVWTEPTLDRIAVGLLAGGFALCGIFPWQGFALLLLPEVLLGVATVLAFRGLVHLPITRSERLRSGFQLIAMLALALGFAGRLALPVVVAPVTFILLGYLLLLVGIVFSYVVAAHYSRAMLERGQPTLTTR